MTDKPQMPAPRKPPRNRPANNIVFPDADRLWGHWQAYKEWTTDPDNLMEIGSRGRRVPRPKTVPGFAAFVQCGEDTVRRAASREDLKTTWSAIEAEINDGLIAGGLLKVLDGHLVSRVARLVDHQAVTTTPGEPVQKYDWSKLTEDELTTVTELLEKAQIED
ncbi:MAG: hypothetical protein Unbinned3138contig1000_2 [Prokaryotic dsDNA virus sp.]|nr:MAG: hypothetical protein Unbinned3138contig1000_2 [Prokaryotic dsDNA virus sp.]|tara:strand:- start:123 stop:611 length:489 start_codon:yes stop_codon:yes gene_type:complete